MKIEVTHKGMRDKDGKPVPVGAVMNIKGDTLPASMVNKVRVLSETAGKEMTVATPKAAKA